ncbi:MAG: hypothetical protein JJ899_14470 [Alphaproteobacteria bacterium]|nr:hypothetical protein [Alphaproteobacteria bacterium]
MATDVTIVNAALIRLGETTLTALSDETKPARLANAIYADVRDAVTRAHPWNFALARAELTANASAPTWGYANAYDLPGDPDHCLRVLTVDGEDEISGRWTVEGRQILSNLSSPIRIVYLRRISDPDDTDPLFREALSARLARELAEPLGKSTSLQQAMGELYEAMLREARSAVGQEGTPDLISADGWLESRF